MGMMCGLWVFIAERYEGDDSFSFHNAILWACRQQLFPEGHDKRLAWGIWAR
jgi:hypothetical protein